VAQYGSSHQRRREPTGVDSSGELGNILGVWAHPDDEAWLSAGLMMRAVANGRHVTCVTATKGEAGFPDDDPRPESERMAVRAAELGRSLEILGVTDHHWLGYLDGQCVEVPDDQPVEILAGLLADRRPDTVVTFGPDGGTGHTDHIAVCRWSTQAVRKAGLDGTRLLYSTKTPAWAELAISAFDISLVMMAEEFEPETTEESGLAVWYSCTDEELARKVEAMRAQESQIEPLYRMLGAEMFDRLVLEEFFREPSPSDPTWD
jgi:LmbE family N-acetylglucosaminyl deacetylase